MSSNIKKIVPIVVCLFLALVVALSSFTIVPEGYRGVKYRLGKLVSDDTPAGPAFCVPFLENIDKVDIREQVYAATTSAYTKDTQTVEAIQYKLTYRLDTAMLSEIIRTIGVTNVESNIIIPSLNSILKNHIGTFKGEELVNGRSVLQEKVESNLREELAPYGIIVSAYNIEAIDFEDTFEQVIREKVEAEQRALKSQNETVIIQEEARQELIRAQADADKEKKLAEAEAYAVELMQDQLSKSPEYINLRLVEKWNGVLPEIVGNEVNPFVSVTGGFSTFDAGASASSGN